MRLIRAFRALRWIEADRPFAIGCFAACERRGDWFVVVIVFAVVVVATDVAFLLSQDFFLLEGHHDFGLDLFTAVAVDRVRDVGIKLGSAVQVLGGAVLAELSTTMIAEARAQMILRVAARAAVH